MVAALLVSIAPVWFAVSAEAGDPGRCERFATGAATRAALVTGGSDGGPEVLVIGDSWSAGLGLSDLGDSWPTRLPGRVRVAGFAGSGFSRLASGCGDVSFASRAGAALSPAVDLVVVEGGLNDHDRTDAEIRTGFARLVQRLADGAGDRPVVVVGPAAAPSRADAVRRVDALLARLSADAGWEYVATYAWELDYLPDGLHLTPAGHRTFGDRVADAVAPQP